MDNIMKNIYSTIEKKCRENNITDFELYKVSSKEEEFRVRSNELDTFISSETTGLSLRVISEGREATSFVENFESSSIDLLFDNTIKTLKYRPSEPQYNILPKSDNNNKEYKIVDEALKSESLSNLKNLCFEMEKKLFELDKRIVNAPYVGLSRYSTEKIIVNSNGVDKKENKMGISYFSEVIAKYGEKVKSAFNSYNARDKIFDVDSFTKETVYKAIDKLESKSIGSGNFKAILTPNALRSLLGSYISLFSSESVQKKTSLLADKINSKIATSSINLYDTADFENGLGNTFFDAEGTTTKKTILIENGALKNFLYNNYTAKKGNTISTGNAVRSYKSSLGIGTHNLVLENGKLSKDELVKKLHNGVIIESLSGLHAGVNVLSGDFSLQAEGIKVENGEKVFTTEPFIVSGNILTLLNSIIEIGNDREYNKSTIYVPSIFVSELSFAS